MRFRAAFKVILSVVLLLQTTFAALAESIPVRYAEGSVHGFLALRTLAGKLIAEGDLVQVTHGEDVSSKLTFRFKDGSVDTDSAVFSQHLQFHLISDHHIQTGPSFPTNTDLAIDTAKSEVTSRFKEKGEEKVVTDHMEIPPDVANGIILDVLKNISPETSKTMVSYIVPTPKPRLVKLAITPQGKETFAVADVKQEAMRFRVKVELGGLVGMLAPLLGKQPADTNVWIADGQAPAFVRSDGPLFLGAPIWSIQMTSPEWSHSQNSARGK